MSLLSTFFKPGKQFSRLGQFGILIDVGVMVLSSTSSKCMLVSTFGELAFSLKVLFLDVIALFCLLVV